MSTQTLAATDLITVKTLVAGTGSMTGEIMTAGGTIETVKRLAKIEIANLMTGALAMRAKASLQETL